MQRITYIYSGETQTFYFNFPYIEKSNIVVTVDGKPAPAYDVIGVKGGLNKDFPFSSGKIVFVKPLKMFQTITIERHMPYNRPVDFQPTAKITSIDLNFDMNNTLELLKDLKDEVDDLREKYENITDSEKIDTVLEKIDLVNTKIVTFADQLQILEQIPDMQELISIIQSNIESINATISEILSSLSALINRTEGLTDYVVDSQLPTAENNYTWYRKYKSGWVEQGGIWTGTNGEPDIILPIEMQDAYYTISGISDNYPGQAGSYTMVSGNSQTTTGFKLVVNFSGPVPGTKKIRWYVCGVSK